MSEAKTTTQKEQPKKNLRWQRDKDREKVRGIFRFYEVPGGSMSFSFKAYKEDQVERYDLVDGQVYTLPLGVAKHLNKNCWYPEYEYIKGEPGVIGGFGPETTMRVGKKVFRCGFQSLEFVDIEDLNQAQPEQLVTVERAGI